MSDLSRGPFRTQMGHYLPRILSVSTICTRAHHRESVKRLELGKRPLRYIFWMNLMMFQVPTRE